MLHFSTQFNNVSYLNLESFESKLTKSPFRVIEVKSTKVSFNNYDNEATIFNNDSAMKVSWKGSNDASHYINQIVLPVIGNHIESNNGCIPINRLSLYTFPNRYINLFDSVPFNWVKDRSLVKRAKSLIGLLPMEYLYLFNAIFWDASRFKRFCLQPSSMIGHHSERNGNLRHSVEVAEQMVNLCESSEHANLGLGLFSALIHDAGKADEYVQNEKGGWDMSFRGKLLGHKLSAVEWIIEAVTKHNIELRKDHYEAILHILTAIPHAPDWMGLKTPLLTESFLLSMADRLSGHNDLMDKTLPEQDGFGKFHKHLKAKPFKVK